MAQDYGILITAPGTDVSGAAANKVLLNTSNPFIKIDTQNTAAFQTLTLIITNDPPEPVAPATDAYTVLYKFKHGYTYRPSLESLFYVTSPPAGATFTQTYFQDFGQIDAHTVADAVYLYAAVDSTYVYLICDKYNAGGGSANNLSGTNVQITTHVFVEDTGA